MLSVKNTPQPMNASATAREAKKTTPTLPLRGPSRSARAIWSSVVMLSPNRCVAGTTA